VLNNNAIDLYTVTSHEGMSHRKTRSVELLVMVGAMGVAILVFYAPILQWTARKFMYSSTHWHWYVALVAIACAARGNSHRLQPEANYAASVLLVICVLAEVINRHTLQINLLSAVLCLLTLHAYSGHVVERAYWMSSKWPVVVGVALLPLDFYLEPYFGYPLRLFTASVAKLVLQGVGFEAISSQSVLLVESRASVVDLDCSGINSLWAGTVFYLLLSWLTCLAGGVRWWLTGIVLIVLLLCSNVFRITVLVILDIHDMAGISEIAHTSLSAVGFTICILIIWKLSETLPKANLKPLRRVQAKNCVGDGR